MIVKSAGKVTFVPNHEVIPQLEAKNYLVCYSQKEGFYLQEQKDFTLPEKIYGNVDYKTERFLNTYRNSNKNLGILLQGDKGTGKSLQAKDICIKSGLPVLIISDPFKGTEFNNYINSIDQECIVFIDEFEKVYRDRSGSRHDKTLGQADLLTLLDGAFIGKKMFLLTANEGEIHDAMLNRPGRVHYLVEYSSLSDDIITAVANDILNDKSHIEELLLTCAIIGKVNMDMVVTLIKECNMYNESPKEACKYLNINPSISRFTVTWRDHDRNRSVEKNSKNRIFEFSEDITINPSELDELYVESAIRPDDKLAKELGSYTNIYSDLTWNRKTKPEIKFDRKSKRFYGVTIGGINFTIEQSKAKVPSIF